MKTCKTCGNDMPYSVLVGGTRIRLNSRSYCLDCSPLKGPRPITVNQSNNTRICAICKHSFPNTSEYFQQFANGFMNCYCYPCASKYATNRGKRVHQEIKNECVRLHGGRCMHCGYDKNIAALCFHHLDPSIKDESIVRYGSLKRAIGETSKCILLCFNCHREEHAKVIFKETKSSRGKRKAKIKCVEYKGGKCIRCGYANCLQALEFHHPDPLIKEIQISYKVVGGPSFEKYKYELDKCEILCANCHVEEHNSL